MSTPLKLDELTRLISECFAHARDNAHFSLSKRRDMMLRGKVLRGQLINLISAHWRDSADPDIEAANRKIAALNRRLQSREETIANFAATVNELADLAGVLESLVGIAAKFI